MPKPSTLPEWATAGGADITEPLLAQKQDGWDVNDRVPAGWLNWWMNLVYDWTSYLNDQVFEGDVTVEGNLFVQSDLQCDGSIGAPTGGIIGDFVQTVGQDIIHGERTLIIPAFDAFVSAGWEYDASNGCLRCPASTGGLLAIGIKMDIGQRLKAVRVVAACEGSVATDVSAVLSRDERASGNSATEATGTLVGSTNLPAAVNTVQKITLNPADTTLAADQAFFLTVSADNTLGIKRFYRIEVDYDRLTD